uniref:Uncharacterized protein n=1 Tax=termite gut metagenome TaxID=433724 RepID=S0DFC8_9ZZZZ
MDTSESSGVSEPRQFSTDASNNSEPSIAIAPEQPGADLPDSEESMQEVDSLPDFQPSPFQVTPQVYDRFVLTENGQVFVYVPDAESNGAIIPVPLSEKKAVCVQPHYKNDGYEGVAFYEYQTTVQSTDGGIYSFSTRSYKGYEDIYGGYTGKALPMGQYIGYMWNNDKRVDGMRWYNARYCLTPNGNLFAYCNNTWVRPYSYTGDLIPIAENVVKAAIGVYSPIQFYLLYLTDEGELYFYTEPYINLSIDESASYFYQKPRDGAIHERVAEELLDFDISGVGFSYEPCILFLHARDGTLSYGKYFDGAASKEVTANEILNRLKNIVNLPDAQYPQNIQWFSATDSVCIVLDNDNILSYGDEYPLTFQTINAETSGLVSASVFHQGSVDYGPPSSRYLLALYENGEIFCNEIK